MKKELIINIVAVLIALISVCVAVARHSDKAEAVAQLASIPSRADIEAQDAAVAAAEQNIANANRELEEGRAACDEVRETLRTESAERDKLKKLNKEREQARQEHMTKLENLRRENAAAEKRIAEAKAKAEAEAKAAAEKAAKEKAEAEAKAKAAEEAKKKANSASSSRRSGSSRNRRRR